MFYCFVKYQELWWRHQRETFTTSLALCEGQWSYRLPVDSLHKDQWPGALMFSLICTRTNGWANNLNAGGLRRHRAHDDVTVMFCLMAKAALVDWTRKISLTFAQNLLMLHRINKKCPKNFHFRAETNISHPWSVMCSWLYFSHVSSLTVSPFPINTVRVI